MYCDSSLAWCFATATPVWPGAVALHGIARCLFAVNNVLQATLSLICFKYILANNNPMANRLANMAENDVHKRFYGCLGRALRNSAHVIIIYQKNHLKYNSVYLSLNIER